MNFVSPDMFLEGFTTIVETLYKTETSVRVSLLEQVNCKTIFQGGGTKTNPSLNNFFKKNNILWKQISPPPPKKILLTASY